MALGRRLRCRDGVAMTKYIMIFLLTMMLLAIVWAYVVTGRLEVANKKLTLSEAENTSLKMEVKNYNEKSLQASKQIRELRELVEAHKDDSSDGYRCLTVPIPTDILDILRK